MLMTMNVAHVNSSPQLGLLKGFQILCYYIQISMNINKFMNLYQLQYGFEFDWVLIVFNMVPYFPFILLSSTLRVSKTLKKPFCLS